MRTLRYIWDRIRIELALVFAPDVVGGWLLSEGDPDTETGQR